MEQRFLIELNLMCVGVIPASMSEFHLCDPVLTEALSLQPPHISSLLTAYFPFIFLLNIMELEIWLHNFEYWQLLGKMLR